MQNQKMSHFPSSLRLQLGAYLARQVFLCKAAKAAGLQLKAGAPAGGEFSFPPVGATPAT
jgi:hypothetical protein